MNTDAIFEAISQAAKAMALDCKVAEKIEQIKSVAEQRCGNCRLWMTSRCAPEKEHGQFKSMNSPGCNSLAPSSSSLQLHEQYTTELEALLVETKGDK